MFVPYRSTPRDLLFSHEIFGELSDIPVKIENDLSSFPTLKLRSKNLNLEDLEREDHYDVEEESPLDVLGIHEVYHLWKLAGGDVFGELAANGLTTTKAPVLSLPKLVLGEGHVEGLSKERSSLHDPQVVVLPLDQLRQSLSEMTPDDCYPFMLNGHDGGEAASRKDTDIQSDDTANLPLVIKEGDVKYQFKRIVLYQRLLQSYPYQRARIWMEAKLDVLPVYRAYIWASLLGKNKFFSQNTPYGIKT